MHFIINNCLIVTMVYLRVDNPYRNSGDAQNEPRFHFSLQRVTEGPDSASVSDRIFSPPK
jgi:hypothetical protein